MGNHKPEITDTSFGMWRRVRLIPFDQTIAEAKRDPRLLETFKGEGPGILNVLLAGLRDCLRMVCQFPRRSRPPQLRTATNRTSSPTGSAKTATPARAARRRRAVLYADYVSWAQRNGHKPLAQARLTRRLNERGYKLAADKRTVTGIAVTAMGEMFDERRLRSLRSFGVENKNFSIALSIGKFYESPSKVRKARSAATRHRPREPGERAQGLTTIEIGVRLGRLAMILRHYMAQLNKRSEARRGAALSAVKPARSVRALV